MIEYTPHEELDHANSTSCLFSGHHLVNAPKKIDIGSYVEFYAENENQNKNLLFGILFEIFDFEL